MQLEVGQILSGKVTGITKYGVFVELEAGKTGMVHISEVAAVYVKEIRDFVTDGQEVKVKVISIADDGKISLSMKQAAAPAPQPFRKPYPPKSSAPFDGAARGKAKSEPDSFDEMLSKFMQSSDDKLSGLKKNGGERRSSRRGAGGR